MAVAHDASSESADSASVTSFDWTHTPVGVPKGAYVLVMGMESSVSEVSAVSYGGASLAAVPGGFAADTAIEPGWCELWGLGSSVPTGAQTVQVTRANNSHRIWAVAITVTADGDTEVTGIVLEQGDQAVTEENVNDGSPGSNSVRYMGIYSGKGNPANLTEGANSTRLHDSDLAGTSRCAVVVRETTAGQGSRPVGVVGTSDDVAAVYFAIREVDGGGGGEFAGAARIFGGWSSTFTGMVVN